MIDNPIILLTSAGSLVGQAVLDVLRGRRDSITLIGGNSFLEHDNLKECEFAVQLPNTSDDGFIDAVEDICRKFKVDLVIPCRDEDVYKLALASKTIDSPIKLINDRADLIRIFRDKWESALWGEQTGVAFSPTLCTDDPELEFKADAFLKDWGYPLISKPRFGNASVDVHVLLNRQQFERTLSRRGIVIQPFLEPPPLKALDVEVSLGVPLFWEVPTNNFKSVSCVISKTGELSSWICNSSLIRLGRLERMEIDHDTSFQEYAKRALESFVEMGWRGPVGIQAKRDRYGIWRAFEVNPRFTGGTSARQLLGFDEVRFILNDWFANEVIPEFKIEPTNSVNRTLRESPILRGKLG